jgi:hypothetical protein
VAEEIKEVNSSEEGEDYENLRISHAKVWQH